MIDKSCDVAAVYYQETQTMQHYQRIMSTSQQTSEAPPIFGPVVECIEISILSCVPYLLLNSLSSFKYFVTHAFCQYLQMIHTYDI